MWTLKLVPDKTRIPFMRMRHIAVGSSIAIILIAIGLFFTHGLNFGIDFTGGIMIEVRAPQALDVGKVRSTVGSLGVGDAQVQEFGTPNDILIRLQKQDEGQAQAVVERVRVAMTTAFGEGVEFRRIEAVGPKVGEELVRKGIVAIVLSMIAMVIYIWFRFEWQFGVGAILSLVHDVAMTVGLFEVFQIEFDLTSIAAVLLIVGYSMNDTVVVFDRIRENLRKYKRMTLSEIIDLSVNETLSRTTVTSVVTLLAIFPLWLFGGEMIRGFSGAMLWGILIGTYSSIFVAGPSLIWFGLAENHSVFSKMADKAEAKHMPGSARAARSETPKPKV